MTTELVKTLEIEKYESFNFSQLDKTIHSLFEVLLQMKDVELNLKYENPYEIINCDVKVVIYLLVEIIENLINKEEKKINFLCEKNEGSISIKICNEITDSQFLENINKISSLDKRISVVNEFNQIKIVI